MRILKLPLAGLLFCVMALFAGCKTSNEPKAPVALTWEMGDRNVLLEEYIEGNEITVGIVNDEVLPVIQVRPLKGFYDFESKYTKGMTEYVIPAQITKSIDKKARNIAMKIYRSFALSGCARIDMIINKNTPSVIDINTSPGMTETSLVPKAWAYLGRTFDDLVERIIEGASIKI